MAWVKNIVVLLALAFFAPAAMAQKLSFPDIVSLLDKPLEVVDTVLKYRGYELAQKENDTTSTLYYYTSIERNTEAPTWVRSLTLIEANVGQLNSRIVSYRTYNSEEYRQLMAFLLAANYRTTDTYKFNQATHTVFDNGKIPVRVKVTDNRLKNGKFLKGYEFEVGL